MQHVSRGFGYVVEPLKDTLNAAVCPPCRAGGCGHAVSRESGSYGTHAASGCTLTTDTLNDSQLGRNGFQGDGIASTASSAVVSQLVAEGHTSGTFTAPLLCLKGGACPGGNRKPFVFRKCVSDSPQQHGRGIVVIGSFTSHGHDASTTLLHHAFNDSTRHHVTGESVTLRHQQHATTGDSVHGVQQTGPLVQLRRPGHASVRERAHQLPAVLLAVLGDGVQLGFESGA